MAKASPNVRSSSTPAVAWLGLLLLSLTSAAASAQEVEWLRRFGAAAYSDSASAVAVDSTGVYVTGRTVAPLPGTTGTDFDAFVRKFSFEGKLLWSRQFKISTSDQPFAIAVDGRGILIAGGTRSVVDGSDFDGGFVSRLTLAGNVVWSHVFDHRKMTKAWSITVHETGIYVGGDVLGIDTDAVLAKLDFDGRESWVTPRGNGTTPNDRFTGVAVDDTGVYGVGAFGAADVRRFDFDGHELAPFGDGTLQGRSIALDDTGVYVAGRGRDDATDYRHWKYDPSGGLSWNKALDGAPGALTVHDGGLHVVLEGSGESQLAKFTLKGNFVWQGGIGQRLAAHGAAIRDGDVYLAGTAFDDAQTDSFVARFSATLPPQLLSLGLIDGSPALATLVHDTTVPSVTVTVRNAASGATIGQIGFPAPYHPHELTMLPDRNGNGAPELALLGVHETTGTVVAQVRDSRSGALLNSVAFDKKYMPRRLAVVPGAGANGQPGLAVLGASNVDRWLRVQIKDSVTGASIGAIDFQRNTPNESLADVVVVPDTNGNGSPELAVVMIGSPGSGSRVEIREALRGETVRGFSLPGNYCVRDFSVAPDVDGNGYVELATLLQGCWDGADRVQVYLVDSSIGGSALLGYGRFARPAAMVMLPDFDGNGAPQLGVVALGVSTDKDVVSIKDSATNLWTHSVTFVHEGYRHRGVTRLPDVNGNGRPEVAQLQERRSDGALRVMIKDAQTGALIRVLP